MTESLKGWRILVVGGSGGIGSAISRALLDEGVAECVVASTSSPTISGVTAELVDVTDLRSTQALAARVSSKQLNAVVNCAGVNGNSRLFADDWDHHARREMEVNYFGLLNLAAAFGPVLARGGGRFVNVLSFLSHVNLPMMASYCASKAAAHSVLQALRAEWALVGVRVCGVYPTAVETRMTSGSSGPKQSPRSLAQDVVQALVETPDALYPGDAKGAFESYLSDPVGLQKAMATGPDA